MNEQLTNLILDNENLIYSIINKYTSYYEKEDLYQVAVMGMIKAYYNFKDTYHTKFTSYAYTYILGEVLKYINNNRNIKLGKEYLYLWKRINEAKSILTQKLMKEPSNYEISLFLEVDERIINEIETITLQVDSLDRVIKEDGKSLFFEDVIPSKNDKYDIDNLMLLDNMNKLDKSQKDLIYIRYFQDKTQQETADSLGISQVQVSRHEKKILRKLREMHNTMA